MLYIVNPVYTNGGDKAAFQFTYKAASQVIPEKPSFYRI